MDTSKYLSEILKWSVKDRIHLIDVVWDSLAESPGAYKLSDEQKKFLMEEQAEYKKTKDAGSAWKDVKKRISDKL